MEDQIKHAEETMSLSGLTCKIFSVIGIIGTIFYSFSVPVEKFKNDQYLWGMLGATLCSSISLAALGSVAESSKRNLALTSLLVKSTNRASQLPINNEDEYSDSI